MPIRKIDKGEKIMGKNFFIRTAVKKLKEGKTIKVADNCLSTRYKTRNNNTEVWMHYPGLEWSKYGTLKEFACSEGTLYTISLPEKRKFIEVGELHCKGCGKVLEGNDKEFGSCTECAENSEGM